MHTNIQTYSHTDVFMYMRRVWQPVNEVSLWQIVCDVCTCDCAACCSLCCSPLLSHLTSQIHNNTHAHMHTYAHTHTHTPMNEYMVELYTYQHPGAGSDYFSETYFNSAAPVTGDAARDASQPLISLQSSTHAHAHSFPQLPLPYEVIRDNPLPFIFASCMGLCVNFLSYLVIQVTSSLTMKVLGSVRNIGEFAFVFDMCVLCVRRVASQLTGFSTRTHMRTYTYPNPYPNPNPNPNPNPRINLLACQLPSSWGLCCGATLLVCRPALATSSP